MRTFSVSMLTREDFSMTVFTDLATDERSARMVLAMIAEPDDLVTGRLLARLGGVETIRLADGDLARHRWSQDT